MKRIIIDFEKCNGCKNCSIACMQAHDPNSPNVYFLDLTNPENESRNYILGNDSGYIPIFCRHCSDPECVNACMSGALSKNSETGLVEYDEQKCASCYMCVMNCSFGVLKPDNLTAKKIIKCDFCKEKDYDPNCVKSCPTKAITVREVLK